MILNIDGDSQCFVIYDFAKDLKLNKCLLEKRGDSTFGAIFVSKDKLCVLDLNRKIAMCNLDGSGIKVININRKGLNKIEQIYPAPMGKILIHADDSLFIYDLGAKKVLAEMTLSEGTIVKQVHWTTSFSHVAVVTQTQIYMMNKSLEVLNTQKESAKIKCGCFDENNSFIYSTSTHLKYIFASDTKTMGTFKSIE